MPKIIKEIVAANTEFLTKENLLRLKLAAHVELYGQQAVLLFCKNDKGCFRFVYHLN